MKKFRFAALLLTTLSALTVYSCQEPTEPDQPEKKEVTGVTLSETAISMYVNEEKSLSATVQPTDAADKTVTWTTSDAGVAAVSATPVASDVVIKGVAAGTAVITAKAGNKTATCTVTVGEPVLAETGEATNITWCSATLKLTVNMKLAGQYKTCDAGVLVGTNEALSIDKDKKWPVAKDASGNPDTGGSYAIDVTDLTKKTKYYYQGYATFDGKNHFGEVKSFETGEPGVSTDKLVDLGLPSGLKWAAWNIGATKPEEFGWYLSWGETKEKTSYWQEDYKYGVVNWYNHDEVIYKYNVDPKYGTVDNRTRLLPEDDAAYVNWGSDWRMPTDAEKTELLANTIHSKYTYEGVAGYLFTSKINGVSIFFPATGVKEQLNTSYVGEETLFWTATLKSNDPREGHMACNWIEGSELLHDAGFEMDPLAESYHLSKWRYFGLPVRAVSGGSIPADAYTLTTAEAASVTPYTAKVNVAMTPAGSPSEFGLLYTDWAKTPLVVERATKAAADASGEVALTGLQPCTDYYACAYAIVDGIAYYGNEITFKTLDEVSLEALAVEDVTYKSAKMNAKIGDLSGLKAAGVSVECGIEWYGNYRSEDNPRAVLTPDSDGKVTVIVDTLSANMNYTYKAYLKIADTYYYSSNKTEFRTSPAPLPQWVDLGLSVLWASYDLGANSPEQDGGRYAWGEIAPKTDFSYDNYRFHLSAGKYTKYVTREENGTVDNKTTLEAADDAATQAWGDGARIPTKEEWEELKANCTAKVVIFGDYVIKVTGPNGNCIYLQIADYYWTSTLFTANNECAYLCYPNSSSYGVFYDIISEPRALGNRKYYSGNLIRPVKSK